MEKEDLTVRAGVEEAREVWRGKDAYGLEDEQENLILDTVGAGESSDKLKFMDGFLRESKQKRVAVVEPGSDKTVDQNGSCVRGKRRAEADDVA